MVIPILKWRNWDQGKSRAGPRSYPVKARLGDQWRLTEHPSPSYLAHPRFQRCPWGNQHSQNSRDGLGPRLKQLSYGWSWGKMTESKMEGGKRKSHSRVPGQDLPAKTTSKREQPPCFKGYVEWLNWKSNTWAHSRHSTDSRHIYSCHCCCWSSAFDACRKALHFKINKWNLIKLYNLLNSEGNHNKAKRQPTDWEKMFANDVTDKA